jgi:quercetin dioxygenase-like cupin family protein
MELLERRRIIGEKAMISHVTLSRGCHVPMHQHANEQFACILSGELLFTLQPRGGGGPTTLSVKAGEVLHLPANVPHAADAVVDTVVLDIFSPPSETTGIDRASH